MYSISEEQKQNLLVFLNRIEYRGLKEVEAVNDILVALSQQKREKEPVKTK